MSVPHAAPGEVIELSPAASSSQISQTLIKTPHLEVIRLVLPAGKKIAEHKVDGQITVQCVKGCIEFTAHGEGREMRAGQLLYLTGGEPHALMASEDSAVIVTILLS